MVLDAASLRHTTKLALKDIEAKRKLAEEMRQKELQRKEEARLAALDAKINQTIKDVEVELVKAAQSGDYQTTIYFYQHQNDFVGRDVLNSVVLYYINAGFKAHIDVYEPPDYLVLIIKWNE